MLRSTMVCRGPVEHGKPPVENLLGKSLSLGKFPWEDLLKRSMQHEHTTPLHGKIGVLMHTVGGTNMEEVFVTCSTFPRQKRTPDWKYLRKLSKLAES
eukprot:COSAG01_NODE_6945_length_3429_cov_1.860961_1_plen_98_part_00